MNELLSPSGYFFVALTLCAYALGTLIQRRWRYALLNPIVLAAAGIMAVLTLLDIPNETYQAGCGILSYLLTPATICLAISFYEQFQTLKKQLPAVLLCLRFVLKQGFHAFVGIFKFCRSLRSCFVKLNCFS